MLEKVMIEWGRETRVSNGGYNLKGSPNQTGSIIGLVKSKNMIWVWEGYGHKISESALFHELVHLAIRAVHGKHGDPDHEGPKYRGWTRAHSEMIIESRQMLRAFEI
jgi:multimeric flavodoxin WrbA